MLKKNNAYSLMTLQMADYVAADFLSTVKEEDTAPSARWNKVEFKKDTAFADQPDKDDSVVYMDEFVNYLVNTFYVYTDDIYGEWSDPIPIDQGGIDPSLYFENGRTFFISNGADIYGDGGVVQCEIDIEKGRKLSESKCIWHGSGGRYLESPHMYKIGDYYYLMAAEGGTKYGHMITCARSRNIWGPFDSYPKNPVLTNRNKAPFIIQGIGHGDLVRDKNGDWHIISLGFRQIHMWQQYHHLGREVFLTPIKFGGDGWFTAGIDGTTDEQYEIVGDFKQEQLGNVISQPAFIYCAVPQT